MKFKKKNCKWGKSSSFSSQMLVTLFLYQTKQSFSPLFVILFAVQRYFSGLSFCLFRHKKNPLQLQTKRTQKPTIPSIFHSPKRFPIRLVRRKNCIYQKVETFFFSKKVANCIAKEPHTVRFNIHLRFVRILYVEFWLRIANESQFWNVNAQNVRLYFACIM